MIEAYEGLRAPRSGALAHRPGALAHRPGALSLRQTTALRRPRHNAARTPPPRHLDGIDCLPGSQKPNYVPIVDWTVASTESVRNGGAIEVTQAISYLRRVATRRLC